MVGSDGRVVWAGRETSRYVFFNTKSAQNAYAIPCTEENARAALEAVRAAEAAAAAARRPPTPPPAPPEPSRADTTASTSAAAPNQKTGTVVKKKGAKPKMSAREKRERGLELEKILAALPLEFRGDDPNLRRHVEMVIEKFLDNPGEAFNSECSFCIRCTGAPM